MLRGDSCYPNIIFQTRPGLPRVLKAAHSANHQVGFQALPPVFPAFPDPLAA